MKYQRLLFLLALLVSRSVCAQPSVGLPLPNCDVVNPTAQGVELTYPFLSNYATVNDYFKAGFLKHYNTLCCTPPEQQNTPLFQTTWTNYGASMRQINQEASTHASAQACANTVQALNTNLNDPSAHQCASAPQTPTSEEEPATDPQADADLKACKVHRITNLPGSGQFASDFLENIAKDPSNPNHVFSISTDASSFAVPHAMWISESFDGGKNWKKKARIDSSKFNNFDGLRNSISVSAGGKDIVITTSQGALQLGSVDDRGDARLDLIPSPNLADAPGESGAGAARISADGKDMVVSYSPNATTTQTTHALQVVSYHREDPSKPWSKENIKELPGIADSLPGVLTKNILSIEMDPKDQKSIYVGTAYDGVFHYDEKKNQWKRVEGIPDNSAIHEMLFDKDGKLHAMACQGVFDSPKPVVDVASFVKRVMSPNFIFNGVKKTGYLRAYSMDINPLNDKQRVLTADSGVFISDDSGKHWRLFTGRNNADERHFLPACVSITQRTSANPVSLIPMGPCMGTSTKNEFRTSHFTQDGSLLLSGIAGSFLANPFAQGCSK